MAYLDLGLRRYQLGMLSLCGIYFSKYYIVYLLHILYNSFSLCIFSADNVFFFPYKHCYCEHGVVYLILLTQ